MSIYIFFFTITLRKNWINKYINEKKKKGTLQYLN